MNAYEDRLEFKPKPSRYLIWFLSLIHIGAAFAVIVSVPAKPLVLCLLVLLLYSFAFAWRRHVSHIGRYGIHRVVCEADGVWLLDNGRDEIHQARLLPSSYLHPKLVILNFVHVDDGRKRNLLLCPDSLDNDCLRRLRARLRFSFEAKIQSQQA